MIERWCLVACVVAASCYRSNDLPPEAWSVADYAAAGLQLDRPWTAADYAVAQRVLASAAVDHPDRLPRFHGAKSGPVLAKLLVDPPDDPASPVKDRLVAHMTRLDALREIAKLYTLDVLGAPSREWIELMGHDLVEAAAIDRGADVFLASLAPDDPDRAHRFAEREAMDSGFSMMIVGGLLVADQTRVPDDDRIAMLGYITAVLPVLYRHAKPELQHQIHDILDKQVAAFTPGPLATAAVKARRALPD